MHDFVVTLLQVIALIGALAGVAWLTLGHAFRIWPSAAPQFAAGNALVALGAIGATLRASHPGLLSFGASDAAVLLAFIFLRSGMRQVTRQRSTMGPALALWLGASAVLLLVPSHPGSLRLMATVFAASASALALLTAHDAWGPLRREFGQRGALLLLWPFGAFGLLMLLRSLALALLPTTEFAPQAPDPFTVGTMWLYVVTVLVVNFNLIGIAILRLFARIRDVADRDALTGVFNRRGLQGRFAEHRARALRRGTPFSAVLLDLDHFKAFNDTHGHAAGDEALCTVTRVLGSLMRQEDAVGRFGGEEFVVLLADTDLHGAILAAERIRAAIAEEPVRLPAATIALTASLGVAQCRAVDDSLDDLLQRADFALYRAKASTRNCVVAWEEPARSAAPVHLPIVTHSQMK